MAANILQSLPVGDRVGITAVRECLANVDAVVRRKRECECERSY